jgi:MFS family permease
MRRAILMILLSSCTIPCALAAQHASAAYQIPASGATSRILSGSVRTAAASRLDESPIPGAPRLAWDEAEAHPTRWKEGAVIGAIVFGALGFLASRLDTPDSGRHVSTIGLTLGGVGVGAILGGLVGGTIPRHVAESNESR